MSATMYDAPVADFARGDLDWERDTFKVMLVTGDYTPDQSSDATRSDLRGFEIPASGSYKAGGSELTGRSVVRTDGGVVRLDGGSVEWSGVSAVFRYAIVYQASGSADSDRLLSYTDFGRAQVVDNARVLLEYDRDGGVVEFVAVAA